jgi:CHAD domain-containing protein
VMTLETLPSLSTKLNALIAPAVVERAGGRRQAAHERLVAQLASARFARMALRLQRWILTDGDYGKPLKSIARPALARAHRQLFEAAQFFAALSADRRHRVRILAKRLRYSLDILAIAFPEQSATRYSEQLSQLQDALGEINDFEVLAAELPRLSRTTGEFAPLQQQLAQGIQARLIPAERCLAALATQLPWEKAAAPASETQLSS